MGKKKKLLSKSELKLKKKKSRFVLLAWDIIAHKFLYYEGAKHGLGDKVIADEEYDKLEIEYKNLSEELNLNSTATDIVGFDYNRGACRETAATYIATKGDFPGSVCAITKQSKKIRKKVNAYHDTLREVMEELNIKESTAKKIRIRMKKRMKP